MLPYRHNRITTYVLIAFFVLAVGYALFEARNLIGGPQITLATSEAAITVDEQLVLVRGSAQNISEIRLNGAPIEVTEEGAFEEPVLLTPGYNKVVISARDKFGRSTEETLEIVYQPPADADVIDLELPTATTTPATSTDETVSSLFRNERV